MSKNTKRYLMLVAAIGLLAIGTGGSGTFATFSAETSNNGNYFATGTLFLHTTKQGGNICKSELDPGNSNITANGCDFLFHVTNLGVNQTQTVNLQLDNAGSINASKMKFALGSTGCVNSTPAVTTTSGAVSSGAQTTISVAALPQALVKGTQIVITDGTNSDTLTMNATAASAATSIDVTGSSTTHAYASGSSIKIFATFGSASLCSNLQFSIQETNSLGGAAQKCIFPTGIAGAACTSTSTLTGITTTLNDLTSDLWSGGSNATALDAGKSRYITITVKSPATFTNTQQNAQAAFDLVWHIEQ